jgi:hypothetical protein
MRGREQFGWSQSGCRRKLPPDGCLEGLREHNARASLVVSHKILGFLETPSSRLASRGQQDRDIGVSRRNPAFHDAPIVDLTIPEPEQILICRPGPEALGEQAERRLRKKNIGKPCSDRHGLVDRDLGALATRAPTEEACAQLNAFLDGKRYSHLLGHATDG